MTPASLTALLEQHFEPGAAHWRLLELQVEEEAGMGFGLTTLLGLSLLAMVIGRERIVRSGTAQPGDWVKRLVCLSAWISLIFAMRKLNLSGGPRYLVGYYPLLVMGLLLSPVHSGRIAPKVLLPVEGGGAEGWKRIRCAKSNCYRGWMDQTMSQSTRRELITKLRWRYQNAGAQYKRKLLDQAQELLGYHRKAAIRALRAVPVVPRGPRIITGRPLSYEPGLLRKWLRPIWAATDYACGQRLVAMLPEWIPAYEQHERRMPVEAREKLLQASARTLDRLLQPLRARGQGRSLTRPGTLLRQQIPIRGSLWEEGAVGWLEVDTVALCGGSVAGEFVWVVDGVEYVTTWVELRAIWGRGQINTLGALQDIEASLPFALLGLDSDNGGEFLNHHVLHWLQKRPRPVFMTRSRPYKKDDNAHVEQKNWTHVRQCFGYERYDKAELIEPMNALLKGPYRQLRNYFHASLKLERTQRQDGKVRRIYGAAQTPLARVLACPQVSPVTKAQLRQDKERLNPFALKQSVEQSLKQISALRQAAVPNARAA
ncbi:MAG: hypothetical protein BWX68_01516 [Verrucomicrobia bacterium ADurb.Bin063]|nr:MAG: hypothetical protein BWX68_01516 [Verrucomicrobia bacterium ADurb.Bin063]